MSAVDVRLENGLAVLGGKRVIGLGFGRYFDSLALDNNPGCDVRQPGALFFFFCSDFPVRLRS